MTLKSSVTSAVRHAQQGRREAFDNGDGHRRISSSMNVIAKRYGQRQKRIRGLPKPKIRTSVLGTLGSSGAGVPTTDTA